MFFFFPIGTDRQLRSTPVVNYALIAANIGVFLFTYGGGEAARRIELQYMLNPPAATPGGTPTYQFITYAFLHAGFMHLFANMVFLFVFGNALEDRLGKAAYLLYYLAGAAMAGAVQAWIEPQTAVVGASGAVAAVSGAYIALFPKTDVTIFYWIIFLLDTFRVSSLVLIIFYVLQDLFFQITGGGQVAYLAHLGGYAFGFTTAMSLLAVGLLPRERYDLIALLQQERRRRSFRRSVRGGTSPWAKDAQANLAPTPPTQEQRRVMDARSRVSSLLAGGQLPAAAEAYLDLLQIDPSSTMGRDAQLDLANELMSQGRHEEAAASYELFLQTYPGYPERHEVQLILALIYDRYLHDPRRAKELAEEASPRLMGEHQDLAQQIGEGET